MPLEADSSDRNLDNEESFDNDNNQLSDNDDEDDEMPEEIGLTTSRQLASKQKKAIKESLETKEAAKKEKRKQLEIKIKNQKNKKLRKEKRREEALIRKHAKEAEKAPQSASSLNLTKLPDDILEEVSDTPVGGEDPSVAAGSIEITPTASANKIVFSDNDDDEGGEDGGDSIADESIADSGYSDNKKLKRQKFVAVNLQRMAAPQISDDVAKFLSSRFSGRDQNGGRKRFWRTQQVQAVTIDKKSKFQKPKLLSPAVRAYEKERNGLIKHKKLIVSNNNKNRLKK